MTVISAIIAVLKAIPTLDSWFKSLMTAYTEWKIRENDKAFAEGLRSLIAEHDQRKIEDAAGMDPGPDPDQDEVVRRPRRQH